MMQKLNKFLLITLGALLVAVGIYFFKFPNNFSTGGVSGISVILGKVIPNMSKGTFVLIINMVLLAVGFSFFGKSFGIKTTYCTLLMSFAIFVLEKVCPITAPLTNQPFLELMYSVILPSVGSAILFNLGASTGGTDIIAMILKKFTSINIGQALFCADFLIVVIAGFVFGIEIALFSLLGLLAKSLVVDNFIESINLSKYCTIITDKGEEVSNYIKTNLHRGATVCNCVGSFSNEKRDLVLTVLNRPQALLLKKQIKSIDPHAFMILVNTSNVLGKGFRTDI